MGYVLGAVRIRKGNGDKTYVLVPNGIDSPNHSATLFVYELGTGGAITGPTELVAGTGTVDDPNGLMSLGMADLTPHGKVDGVSGGHLKGNVYRRAFSGPPLPTGAVQPFQATNTHGTPHPPTGP